MDWKNRLRERIALLGLSNAEVARRAGVGPKLLTGALHNHVGQECIIQLPDGERLVGVLLQGSNAKSFNIRPFDIRAAERRDVTPALVAPIRMILRGN